jgi:hypothetical protein
VYHRPPCSAARSSPTASQCQPKPRRAVHSASGRAAGITTKIGAHTFRATSITAYLKKQRARWKLYDRRSDEMALDEVEKIAI